MASIIRIKKSTGTVAPPSLNFGELGLTVGVGTHGNNGGRLFAGDNSSNAQIIGGRYYADLLSIAPGLVAGQSNPTTPSNGFVAILDQNRKVDEWNIDNITIDGNTLSSTNTDGDINIDPNGSGEVSIPDDTYLSFGTSKDTKFRYDESTNDRFEVEGADWYYSSGVSITIDDITASTSPSTGALVVTGGVGFGTDLNVGGSVDIAQDLTVDGNVTLGNGASDEILITGITTFTGDIIQVGQFVNSGGLIIDNIGISSNVISTRSGGGDKLFIDPYPDGLSNEGTVIIKGDLQVDGTTTTVNSSTITVNDPILALGDVTSARTVMETVQVGVTTIRLDSVVGINTGDTVQGTTALGSGGIATVTSYDDSEKIITIDSNTTAGISTQTQLTITHAYDTNTDRGVSFDYNTSFGVSNNKTGFFGYDDSTGYWTFIPDATIANSVVSGIKGTLDIGSLLLDFTTVGIHTRGSAYFDSNGKLISTNEPEVGYASTSNYILTTDASNTPVWTDTLDGGYY
jgi:hypothetical protein